MLGVSLPSLAQVSMSFGENEDIYIDGAATVKLSVDADLTGEGLLAYEFAVTYQSSYLAFDRIETTDGIASQFTNLIVNDNGEGRIEISSAGISELTGEGLFFTLHFDAVGNSGTSSIGIADGGFFNEGSPEITVAQTGSVRVNNYPVLSTSGPTELLIGETGNFSAWSGTEPYVWSVENTDIGTIDTEGVFTASGVGVTNVIVTDDAQGKGERAIEVRGVKFDFNESDEVYVGQPTSIDVLVNDVSTLNAYSGEIILSLPYETSAELSSIDFSTGLLANAETQYLHEGRTLKVIFASSSALPSAGSLFTLHFETFSSSSLGISIDNTSYLNENLKSFGASSSLNVQALPVLSLTSGAAVKFAGETIQFTASNGTEPYTWSVDNENVVSIDEDGLLTVLEGGKCIVTVQDVNGATKSSSQYSFYDSFLKAPQRTSPTGTSTTYPLLIGAIPEGKGIGSFQVDFDFDPNAMTIEGVESVSTLSEGWSVLGQLIDENTYRIVAAGSGLIDQGGELIGLNILLNEDLSEGDYTNVSLSNVLFNEGDPIMEIENGRITIGPPPVFDLEVSKIEFEQTDFCVEDQVIEEGSFTVKNLSTVNLDRGSSIAFGWEIGEDKMTSLVSLDSDLGVNSTLDIPLSNLGITLNDENLEEELVIYVTYPNDNDLTNDTLSQTFLLTKVELVLPTDFSMVYRDVDTVLVATPEGGSWNGTGISSDGTFRTTSAEIGEHKVFYTYNENNCTFVDSLIITVDKAPASLEISNLYHVYDGNTKSVTVSTNPSGVEYTVTYNDTEEQPVELGDYAVVATITDSNYFGEDVTATLSIREEAQTVTLDYISPLQYQDTVLLSATSSVGLDIMYRVVSGPGSIVDNNKLAVDGAEDIIVEAYNEGTTSIAGATDRQTVFVSRKTVSIEVSDLVAKYDGTEKMPTVTLSEDVSYTLSYTTIETNPTEVGDYDFIVVVDEELYKGDYSGTFTITNLEIQEVTFDVPNSMVYNEEASISVTSSSGLDLTLSVIEGSASLDNNRLIPNSVGTIKIEASNEGDDTYFAVSETITIEVVKASASILMSDLVQKFDGNTKTPTITTVPSWLNYSIDFGDVSTVEVGEYSFTVTINDDNYEGSESGTLTITNLDVQELTIDVPSGISYNETVIISATSSSSLPVTIEVLEGPATLDGNSLTSTGVGLITLKASNSGDATYAEVEEIFNVEVSKATATITVSDLVYQYDGTEKAPVVTTNPDGLNYTIDFGGVTPMELGDYPFVITVNDDNYQGSTSETLVITDLQTQTLTFDFPTSMEFGETAALTVTSSSGLPVTLEIEEGIGTLDGNNLTVEGIGLILMKASNEGDDTFYGVSETVAIQVVKATAEINLSNLEQLYDGELKYPTVVTTPIGLNYEFNFNGETPIEAGEYSFDVTINDDNYEGTTSGILVISTKQSQNVSFAPSDMIYNEEQSLEGVTSSGLSLVYEVISGPANIDGNVLKAVGTGMVTIQASNEGNENYTAVSVTVDIEVSKANQTLDVSVSSELNLSEGSYQVSGSASSSLSLSFALKNQVSGIEISTNGLLTFTEAGTVTIIVSQLGNDNYNTVEQEFSVTIINDVTSLVDDLIEVSFFPNPVKRELKWKSTTLLKNYTLMNSSGKLIKSGAINVGSINFEGLADGVYILKVEDNIGKQKVVKIIK